METGVVKFYDSSPGKRSGSILLESGEEIIFDFRDGQFVLPGETEPKFSGSPTLVIQGSSRSLRDPRKDDKVVFVRTRSGNRDKACTWGYVSQYERAKTIIASRPIPLVYRIIQGFRIVGTGQETPPSVIWTGSDLNEHGLERHYNPVFDRPGGNEDIDWRKDWQVSADGGKTWSSCECPSAYASQFDTQGRRRR